MTKTWRDGPAVTTDLLHHIINQRSIADVERFLAPQWPDHLHDPFLLPDMKVAVGRLHQAIERREPIGIVGDYDMDGTPGAVLLAQFFQRLDCPVKIILPTRQDGYGFSPIFVKRLVDQGIKLIVTIDCGIRDFAAVDEATKLGAEVIIIDHHECAAELPKALAIVNPKRPDSSYPCPSLCGTGVAFKVLQALLTEKSIKSQLPEQWLAWSLDLVVLATIGDMVPLVDENRLFAFYGLKVIQKGARPGLARFLEAIDLDSKAISYRDIAFKMIPKLNASGRLESMDDVVTLLLSMDSSAIDTALKRILTRDTQRQLLSTTAYNQARAAAEGKTAPIIVVHHKDWHPGVTGLVASRLVEDLKRPVAVLGTLDGQLYRGSMRSIPGVALPDVLQQATTILDAFGGHNEAAGLSIQHERLTELEDILAAIKLAPQESSLFETDGTIQVSTIDLSGLEQLQRLAPWGIGHAEPNWSLCDVRLQSIRWLGEKQNHLKATVVSSAMSTAQPLDVIYFGAEAYRSFDFSTPVDLYGTLSINEFRGNKTPQLQVRGLAPTQLQ